MFIEIAMVVMCDGFVGVAASEVATALGAEIDFLIVCFPVQNASLAKIILTEPLVGQRVQSKLTNRRKR